jgi:AraC family transcriptional regulator
VQHRCSIAEIEFIATRVSCWEFQQDHRVAQQAKKWASSPVGGEVAVRSIRRWDVRHDLIDFSSSEPSRRFTLNERLSFEPVTLAYCTSHPVEGRYLGATQVIVAIHDGKAFEMDWRGAESDRIQSNIVSHGQAHVGDARLPFWVRYRASPSFFAFALDERFVAEIWQTAFEGAGDFAIRTSVGIHDPVIGRLGALGRRELSEGGAGGRLYVEGLAAMLTVHLLRDYGSSERSAIPHKGGLTPRQMQRVIDYINAHLSDELGLVELAAIAGLSPHHFGEAFKTSMGTSPHRYVIERRVQHALELLREKDRSIAEIAHAAGFSSQSHLTANFRRVTGLTPGRFRQSLG